MIFGSDAKPDFSSFREWHTSLQKVTMCYVLIGLHDDPLIMIVYIFRHSYVVYRKKQSLKFLAVSSRSTSTQWSPVYKCIWCGSMGFELTTGLVCVNAECTVRTVYLAGSVAVEITGTLTQPTLKGSESDVRCPHGTRRIKNIHFSENETK